MIHVRRAAAAPLHLFIAVSAWAQDGSAGGSPEGRWAGSIEVPGGPIAVAVSLEGEADGADGAGGWRGTIDLPSAGVLGAPLRGVQLDGRRVRFELPTSRGPMAFDGELNDAGILGRVRLDGRREAFALRRSTTDPPPYRAEAITFSNDRADLSGTLLLPESGGPHPAVVFLHGSGPERRDAARFWADRLARCGVASLIWDKRGTGASTPESPAGWVRARWADLAGDAAAAIERLRHDRRIDGDRIGLFGPSLGAWLAPVAAARDGRTAFLVLVSGGGVTLAEHELHDDVMRLRGAGYADIIIFRATALQGALHRYLRTGDGRDDLAAALDSARAESWFDLTELPSRPPPLSAIESSWWRRHMDYDPTTLLVRLDLPVLAIFGAEDEFVPVEESVRRLEKAVATARPASSLVRVFPDADHTLHVWEDPDRRGAWPRLAPGAADLVVSWIVERTRDPRHAEPSGCT